MDGYKSQQMLKRHLECIPCTPSVRSITQLQYSFADLGEFVVFPPNKRVIAKIAIMSDILSYSY